MRVRCGRARFPAVTWTNFFQYNTHHSFACLFIKELSKKRGVVVQCPLSTSRGCIILAHPRVEVAAGAPLMPVHTRSHNPDVGLRQELLRHINDPDESGAVQKWVQYKQHWNWDTGVCTICLRIGLTSTSNSAFELTLGVQRASWHVAIMTIIIVIIDISIIDIWRKPSTREGGITLFEKHNATRITELYRFACYVTCNKTGSRM